MSFRITKDFSGLEKLIKNLKKLENTSLEYGFFEDKRYGPDNDNLPVAAVASWNETGLAGPARPFFSSSVDQNKKEYFQLCKQVATLAVKGLAWRASFKAIGTKAVRDVQDSIRNWTTPANSPSWIAFKASVGAPTKPLEYTGVMVDSVDFKLIEGGRK